MLDSYWDAADTAVEAATIKAQSAARSAGARASAALPDSPSTVVEQAAEDTGNAIRDGIIVASGVAALTAVTLFIANKVL